MWRKFRARNTPFDNQFEALSSLLLLALSMRANGAHSWAGATRSRAGGESRFASEALKFVSIVFAGRPARKWRASWGLAWFDLGKLSWVECSVWLSWAKFSSAELPAVLVALTNQRRTKSEPESCLLCPSVGQRKLSALLAAGSTSG